MEASPRKQAVLKKGKRKRKDEPKIRTGFEGLLRACDH